MGVHERRVAFRATWVSRFASAAEAPRDSFRKNWARLVTASPGRIALLWAMAAALDIASAVAFPSDDILFVSSPLYFSGTSIFAGLVVAWALHLKRSTLHFLSAMISLALGSSLVSFALKFATPAALDRYVDGVIGGLYLSATVLIIHYGYGALRGWRRRAAAILLVVGVNIAALAMLNMGAVIWRVSLELQPLLGRREPSVSTEEVEASDIEEDRLWGEQPALIESSLAAVRPRVPGRTNVFLMAVAGSGAQALFSREAHEALRVATLHFGGDSRGGVLLSNGAVDHMHSPLATRANMVAIGQGIGQKASREQDLIFVYLASHGSQNAELQSVLPGYRSVQPISSVTTAEALQKAAVARRVVVVSACYSATWIPALADDNTIVITASAKDRTSFGCDDTRRFTYFGEAFLGSLSMNDISLRDAFENARRKISAKEREENLEPSLPQAFVGRNMHSLWVGEPEGSSANKID